MILQNGVKFYIILGLQLFLYFIRKYTSYVLSVISSLLGARFTRLIYAYLTNYVN
jgi:hypothetical protein